MCVPVPHHPTERTARAKITLANKISRVHPFGGCFSPGGAAPIQSLGVNPLATAIPKPPTEAAVVPARLSDRALFARAADDELAFAEIVRRYQEPLRRHAARYVGETDAEDVVQQALVNASLALRREPDRDIEPKPWLYRVTTNAAIDHQRAQSVRPLGDRVHSELELDAVFESHGGDPHDVIADRDSVRSVVAGINGLAPNQRRAATARFMEGRSHDEIAAELGVSKGAARELIHRARRNLRDAIPALSPVPLFVKLREVFAGAFSGAASVPAAKLAASAAAVAVVAGAGGVALKNGLVDQRAPTASGSAAAPAAAIPDLPQVAPRPRLAAAATALAAANRRNGSGGEAGGPGGGSTSTSAATPGTAPASATPATTTAGTSTGSGAGTASDSVGGLSDQLGVDEATQGVQDTVEGLGVPEISEQLGIQPPNVPDVADGLGGN